MTTLAPSAFDRGYAQALKDVAEKLSNAEENHAGPEACRVYTYEIRDQLIELADERTRIKKLLRPLVNPEELQ